MTAWTVTDWLMLVCFVGGAIGVVLRSQHSLITGLLKAKWQEHEKRIEASESRLDDHDNDLTNIRLDVKEIQTVCKLRQLPREGHP